MADLIPPHGGLSEPVNRNVPAAEADAFRARAAGLPRLAVSDADLSTLYRMGDGGLSLVESKLAVGIILDLVEVREVFHAGHFQHELQGHILVLVFMGDERVD